MKTLVFNIIKGSFSDGKGIRSVVFFKGCPLRCLWCHNPESWSYGQETFLRPEKCLHCGNCSTGCPSGAMETVGRYYDPENLAAKLIRDNSFYNVSGGGVTYSGGEPLSHPEYIARLSRILKKREIHITIETSGEFHYEPFEKEILPYTDCVLFDLKIIDPQRHKEWTGKTNHTILENLDRLSRTSVDLAVSVPFIPGFTTDERNWKAIARLVRKYDIKEIHPRFYHTGGREKWEKLGRIPPAQMPLCSMTREECRTDSEKFQGLLETEQIRSR
jgi:pyruvate formate lyase activating enzyme